MAYFISKNQPSNHAHYFLTMLCKFGPQRLFPAKLGKNNINHGKGPAIIKLSYHS